MPSEVDEHGIPARGTALHIAYYVNVAPVELDATLGEQLLIEHPIQWVSPLVSDRFAEYHDRAFLEAVGQGGLGAALEAWWPRGGAHWDALGVAADGAVVLVEAKANIAEMTSGAGSQAGRTGSPKALANREQIAQALRETRQAMGVHDSEDSWMSTHCYQHANRLAYLQFLKAQHVPARLAFVYFIDDHTHIPTPRAHFDAQRQADARALGIDAIELPDVAGVYLPAIAGAHERLRALVESLL
ncbi:MAG: hypothetical protein LC790_23110 [Actinobacteria bacterium]|nr:hypothetical protein [Actinomycetota bacterium]